MLIDAHAHLTNPVLQEGLDQLLSRAQLAKIEAIVNVCTTPEETARGLELHEKYPWVYTACATPPHDVEIEGEKMFPLMQSYAHQGALIAVGETGLDYHYYANSKDIQQVFLRRYLRLAAECELPVVIHCREAFSDLFRILDEEYVVNGCCLPGMLHCFTGTLQEAQELVNRGWYVSLSGIAVFKKSVELQEVAKALPLHQLLIETDSPYLAPPPYRGKRNEPAYLVATAEHIASLRGISLEQLADATSQNARTLFKLRFF